MRPSICGLDAGRAQVLVDHPADLLDEGGRLLAAILDLLRERVVGRLVDVAEGEVLELVLDLGHPEAARDRRVDVERLARDPLLAVLGQVLQRAHVVQAVGELHQDHPDVVDHRQQHLAVGLGLALLAGGERDLRDLGDAFDDVEHVRSRSTPGAARASSACPRARRAAGRPRRRSGPSASRPGSPPPPAGARGRARRRRAPAPCARPPKRCKPCGGFRDRRPGGASRPSPGCPRSGSWPFVESRERGQNRSNEGAFLDSPLSAVPIIRFLRDSLYSTTFPGDGR